MADQQATISDYTIGVKIGSGGFGQVHRARDNWTGEVVAIKKCHKNHLIQKKIPHLVKRERHALALMDHHFIIRLHEAFQDKLTLYLVFDYIRNGTLKDKLDMFYNFKNEVTRFYSAEIIMALEYLRKKDIIHRDIKLANILLDEKFHIKLCDFGMSVVIDKEDRYKKHHRLISLGTPGHHAPETLNFCAATFGTDLWGLGCVIYECHTGLLAFPPGPKCDAEIRKGRYRRFPEGSDPSVMDLVHKLLTVNPTKRLGHDNLNKLKTHFFYGTEDVDKWEVLHLLTPPPFDPEVNTADWKNGLFDASRGCYPRKEDPPALMDWDLDVARDEMLNSTRTAAPPKKKCCVQKSE